MAQVGSLVIDLIAETASFNANITRASQQLNSEATKMNRSLDSISKGINTVVDAGKALVAFELGQEIGRLATRGLEYASSLGEVSQQLGVTAQDLQTYRYAATQVGLTQEEMDGGLQKLTRSLGQAQLGSKKQSEVFKALGVDLRTATGEFKTAGDVLPEIAQALSKIPDPARRAAIETQLFGRAGQQLDTLLAGGSGAIDELRNAAQRLGIVLSNEQIQRADDTADKLAAIKMVLEARIAGIVADNAGAIMQLAASFEYAAGKGAEFLTTLNDLLAGADKIKATKGYWAFLTTPLDEMRKAGSQDRLRQQSLSDGRALLSGSFNRPKPTPVPDIDTLLAGSGSGSRSRSARAIREVKSEADKLNESLAELRDQNNGMLESTRLPYEIGGPDDPLMKAFETEDFYKNLREVSKVNTQVTKEIGAGWRQAAEDVLGSLQSLAYGIQNGNFLSIFGGVLELLMGLGSAGVFGSKIATGLNGAKGYATGGYTGNGGVDEIAGFVHGKEYVFDAKAVSRIGIDNLERLRKGYKNGGYVGGGLSRVMSSMEPAPRVVIAPTKYFEAVVDNRALAVAAPVGMRAAQAGASQAEEREVRRRKNRIPGR